MPLQKSIIELTFVNEACQKIRCRHCSGSLIALLTVIIPQHCLHLTGCRYCSAQQRGFINNPTEGSHPSALLSWKEKLLDFFCSAHRLNESILHVYVNLKYHIKTLRYHSHMCCSIRWGGRTRQFGCFVSDHTD